MNEPGGTRPVLRDLLGWLLLLALVGFTALVHDGIGPSKPGLGDRWYTPSTFFHTTEWIAPLVESPGRAFASLVGGALLLTIAVFLGTRSAIARAIALSCLVACVLFTFYGEVAPLPWEFFGWRGSAVLVLTAVAVGFSAAAPLLARSWLRLGWPLRVLVYLPFFVFVVAFLRNATGTDPNLPFAISPWPVVPVFGLEVGALFVALWLVGTAIGLAGLSASGAGSRQLAGGGAALGLATPCALLLAGSALGIFPFSVDRLTLALVAVACAATTFGLCVAASRDVRVGRARIVGAGALLLGAPLVAGQAWAYWDYHVTREIRAREIIDGLQQFAAREEIYPDTLDELLTAGDLESIPEPSIGFGALYDGTFRYQNFGTSFMLEFPAPRWVECAYTPPYLDDDEDPDADLEPWEQTLDDDALDEAWSCPSKPPELW